MKTLLRVAALLMLLVIPACALAEKTPCYWQLESIEVASATTDAYGPAQATTDVTAVSESDPAAMTEIVRGVKNASLDITRAIGGYNAPADYTLSGVPALVPGAA